MYSVITKLKYPFKNPVILVQNIRYVRLYAVIAVIYQGPRSKEVIAVILSTTDNRQQQQQQRGGARAMCKVQIIRNVDDKVACCF